MTFLYTARGTFDQNNNGNGMSWASYIEWSKLIRLTELISLDGMLNEILIEPDRNNANDWNFIHTFNQYETGFFTTMEYVLNRLKAPNKFHLLTVVIEPDYDCRNINVDSFNFIVYDLLDQSFGISALTNCGGFDETFLPTDLNDKGLIDDFSTAYDINRRLLQNNPNEFHADTNVIAVWRHDTIGR